MVSEKVIVALLVVAIILSVFSIVMTLSLNIKISTQIQQPEIVSGNTQGNVNLLVNENPEAGPQTS